MPNDNDAPTTEVSSDAWPLRPREPRAKTVEELDLKLVRFEGGDWRAGLAGALGAGWAEFFDALPPAKIRRLADVLFLAATSSKSSTRTKLRTAQEIMKIFLQGTKALADLMRLAGTAPRAPSGGNVLVIDLAGTDAIEQLERHLGVLREMQAVRPALEVSVSPGGDSSPSLEELAEEVLAEESDG